MKSVFTFTNPADLVREYHDGPLSDDIMFELDHVNDFESFGFLVIDNKTVITYDVLNGDVYSQTTVEEYVRQSIEYAEESYAAFQAAAETAFENEVIAEMEARHEI